jgi:hypothetical protein
LHAVRMALSGAEVIADSRLVFDQAQRHSPIPMLRITRLRHAGSGRISEALCVEMGSGRRANIFSIPRPGRPCAIRSRRRRPAGHCASRP